MNGYHDAKQRCRDSLVRAVKKYSQPTGGQPSEYFFPINRLPQDVLAEVFVQCIPKLESWSSIEGLPSKACVVPLLLCSVSSSWRKLVLSVPRLWQRLSIRFESMMPKAKTEEVILLIHGWIKRSGVLPLALSLHLGAVVSWFNKDMVDAVQPVLGAVLQYSSRWEHFHYYYMDDAPISFPEFGDRHHLRGFSFSLCRGLEDPKLQISSWPMLMALSSPLHPTASSNPSPPWHQLTRLALGRPMKARETLLVIQSCPRLAELEIKDYRNDSTILDPPPCEITVVNDSLRKLDLHVRNLCMELLKRLTLPVLNDLTLYFDPCAPCVHKELLHFFTRSKCKLDRFHLVDPCFDDDMLMVCLEHDSCTSITDLSITNISDEPMITDLVLVSLTDVPDGNMVLPNLAHLEFHLCVDGSPGILGTMLVSRRVLCDEEDQLKTVKVFCRSLSRSDIVLVALAESLGLKVTLDIVPLDYDDL